MKLSFIVILSLYFFWTSTLFDTTWACNERERRDTSEHLDIPEKYKKFPIIQPILSTVMSLVRGTKTFAQLVFKYTIGNATKFLVNCAREIVFGSGIFFEENAIEETLELSDSMHDELPVLNEEEDKIRRDLQSMVVNCLTGFLNR
ncbi:hypothetical protein L9F63_024113 [Diploptera punctata]|uniref:Uncharacterized protein n=1 Tax=Diploptera punctata TaxID=6984 RepID=A0AAD7ZI03_DIPPU|nr:hypothetical protein L9F63_024113 [Diploptera punctata]